MSKSSINGNCHAIGKLYAGMTKESIRADINAMTFSSEAEREKAYNKQIKLFDYANSLVEGETDDIISQQEIEAYNKKEKTKKTWKTVGLIIAGVGMAIAATILFKKMYNAKNALDSLPASTITKGEQTTLNQVKHLKPENISPVLQDTPITSYKFPESELMEDFKPLLNKTMLKTGISTKNQVGDCFIKGTADIPLSTSGVGNCSVICLQNSKTGTHALYHAFPIKRNAVELMQEDIELIMPEGFDKVFIVPGRDAETATTSINLLNAAVKINKNAKVAFRHSAAGNNVQIILYKGKVYSLPFIDAPIFKVCENPENYDIRMLKK